jgi:predicted nucleotidyltransferase
VGEAECIAAIERFRVACARHRLVAAAFLGGSYAAGRARADSDIDLYLITTPEDYPTFIGGRREFMESWGEPVRLEDVWNFEGLGFDMVIFTLADGVEGELALGTTANLMKLHGGPHQVLIDKVGVLDGVSFPLL